jgi:hypothetical protein
MKQRNFYRDLNKSIKIDKNDMEKICHDIRTWTKQHRKLSVQIHEIERDIKHLERRKREQEAIANGNPSSVTLKIEHAKARLNQSVDEMNRLISQQPHL